MSFGFGFGVMFIFFKEIKYFLMEFVVVWMFKQGFMVMWVWQFNVYNFIDCCLGVVGYYDYVVCQKDGFVYVMGYIDCGDFGVVLDFYQYFLQFLVGEVVEYVERFIQ